MTITFNISADFSNILMEVKNGRNGEFSVRQKKSNANSSSEFYMWTSQNWEYANFEVDIEKKLIVCTMPDKASYIIHNRKVEYTGEYRSVLEHEMMPELISQLSGEEQVTCSSLRVGGVGLIEYVNLQHDYYELLKNTQFAIQDRVHPTCIMNFLDKKSSNDGRFVRIPDPKFKAYLLANNEINTNGDGEIQAKEAASFSGSIDCSNLGITDLTGIEAFGKVTELNCTYNPIKRLDISKNIKLKTFDCDKTDVQSLDVSKNINLKKLFCGATAIQSLDISKNIKLKELWCYNTPIQNLDVSKNVNLKKLFCNGTKIQSLDVSKNAKLVSLNWHNTKIQSIDISKNVKLETLSCYFTALQSLDVSNNVKLVELYCNNTDLQNLNVSKNIKLTKLNCFGTKIQSLDVSNNVNLKELYHDDVVILKK